jgi:glycine C-acetyltransferase
MAVPMEYLAAELEEMKRGGFYGTIRTLESPQGARVRIDGREYLNLCSNNYLGLCNDPRLVAKVKEYADRYGVGPGAVRTIAGTMSPHIELERKLAEFKGA